jgi:hypothetical protein
MNIFEQLGKQAADEVSDKLKSEDVLATEGWGPWLSDYFGSSSSYNRAGRGRAIARALGKEKAPFTVEHPVISSLLANRLGMVLGGAAGLGLGGLYKNDPTMGKLVGSTVGSTVGELLGSNVASFFRRRQLKNLANELQGALDKDTPLTPKAPPADWLNYVPAIGPGRAGETEAYLQLKHKNKAVGEPDLVAAQEIVQNTIPGITSPILQSMQGYKAKQKLKKDMTGEFDTN